MNSITEIDLEEVKKMYNSKKKECNSFIESIGLQKESDYQELYSKLTSPKNDLEYRYDVLLFDYLIDSKKFVDAFLGKRLNNIKPEDNPLIKISLPLLKKIQQNEDFTKEDYLNLCSEFVSGDSIYGFIGKLVYYNKIYEFNACPYLLYISKELGFDYSSKSDKNKVDSYINKMREVLENTSLFKSFSSCTNYQDLHNLELIISEFRKLCEENILTFDEVKQLYDKRLQECKSLVSLIKDNDLLLRLNNPTNDVDIRFDKAYLDYLENRSKLIGALRDGKVEIVPIEDNFVVKIIAYALKKDGMNLFCLEDFNHIIKQLNPTVSLHESYALAVYHDTISSAYNTKDTFNYFKEVDPLIEYPLHAGRFSQIFDDVMNHLNDISNGKYFCGSSIEDFSIEFKKLCDNGIKKEEDESQIIMSDKKKKKVY